MNERPKQDSSTSDSLQHEVEDRFGVLPNFFRLAPEAPGITENLWGFAKFGYLDNPLPPLFKERLFVYLSRFCEVRYCIARHVGFLAGLGRPAGDRQCPPETVEQIVKLLRRPLPRGDELEPQLALLEAFSSPPPTITESGTPTEEAVFACAAHVFLQTPQASRCLEGLRHVFDEVMFQHLLVFLAFVRTAHFWTKLHPELQYEKDIADLLSVHEVLAECVVNDPEAASCETTQSLVNELAVLRRERTLRREVEIANQALRERERQLRLVADHAPVLIAHCDAEQRYEFVNRAYAKMFGCQPTEVVGRMVSEVLGPASYRHALPYLEAVLQGKPTQYEMDFPAADGRTPQSLKVAYEPEFDSHGQVVGFVAAITDITDRKQAEAAVRESEARYRAIGEAIDYGVWMCDAEGRNTYASESFLRLVGITQEQCSGDGWGRILHPDDAAATIAAWKECVRTGGMWDQEHCFLGVDGQWHYVLARGIPIRNEQGVVLGWAGINLDIDRLKSSEAALREADRRKDEFLATLAHELRNPLAPIRNGLQIMRLAQGEPEATEQARAMMERQLEQMVHLVDDLLDLSRISRGKIQLRKERIELAKIIRQAVETSRPAVDQAGHELLIDVPTSPIYVDADLTRLAQVFSNLLNNAAKYTERGGQVRLTMQRQENEVVVAVKDSGIGIPPHMLPNVFEMFTQVDRNLERSQGGLGIGLSIVKRLVEMHDGSVEAKSDGHGLGSEFIVRLPRVLSIVPPQQEHPGLIKPSSRRRVLVVDDNKDAAVSLAMMLKLMGNEAETAHDGIEALELAAAFRPDLILLDIGMPRLNGYDTAKEVRKQAWGKDVVLVALTGWGQEDDRRKSDEAGFDSHMIKPIDPAALEKLLANVRANTA